MAEDPSNLLEQLRAELELAGYDAVLLEDALAHADSDRTPEAALDDLLEALNDGVVTAMLAHAASIRLLQSRPGPRGKVWEPLPTRAGPVDDAAAFVLRLDADEAGRIEELAERLQGVITQLRDSDANEG